MNTAAIGSLVHHEGAASVTLQSSLQSPHKINLCILRFHLDKPCQSREVIRSLSNQGLGGGHVNATLTLPSAAMRVFGAKSRQTRLVRLALWCSWSVCVASHVLSGDNLPWFTPNDRSSVPAMCLCMTELRGLQSSHTLADIYSHELPHYAICTYHHLSRGLLY